MGLSGDTATMSLPELLGWVSSSRKSGTLEVEHDKIIKRVMFRTGRVIGCSSNEPATLMGQFLLSRGRITHQQLGEAMRRQKEGEGNLGKVLIEMGAISPIDEDEFVTNKIEETIGGLFDWNEAVFHFHTDELPDPNILHVDLEVRQILERGLKRTEQRKHSRETISDPGVVLRRTGRPEPPELADLPAAKRVLGLVDGEKTVAEIRLHSHAPEFLVTRFLTALVHGQVLEIVEGPDDEEAVAAFDSVPEEPTVTESAAEVASAPSAECHAATAEEPAAPTVPTAPDDPTTDGPPANADSRAAEAPPAISDEPAAESLSVDPEEHTAPLPAAPETPEASGPRAAIDPPTEPPIEPVEQTPAPSDPEDETLPGLTASIESALSKLQWEPESSLPTAASTGTPEVLPEPRPAATPAPSATENSRELQEEINVVLRLMASGQPGPALELLNAMSKAHPGDVAVSKLIRNAEDDYREQMLAGELGASKIPRLTHLRDSDSTERPTAEEGFLIDHIDGSTDIQSLLWVSPMRDVEVLQTLSALLRKGWIEVRQAA
jgi:hypothetical protein